MDRNLEFKVNELVIKARRCKKEDYDFVYGIVKRMIFPFVKEYFPPSKPMFDERFARDYRERMILLRGKRRIGFYQLTPKEDRLDVTGIFLSPDYQSRGIGKQMMHHFENLGFRRIRLKVWENNKSAYRFYKRLGYKVISKKDHKYLMEKKISR